MKKQSLLFLCSLGLVVVTTWAPESEAWPRFDQGCLDCHGSFTADNYTSRNALDDANWGKSLHLGHQDIANDECEVCHDRLEEPNLNDRIDLAQYCSGCHGRDETQTDVSSSAGLRQHHTREVGANLCIGCHADSNPDAFSPVGEDVQPLNYDFATVSLDACNSPCATRRESQFGNLGLDNDGDTDYDQLDLNCVTPLDTDEDCVADIDDNCTTVPNADQRDTDNDGFGNVCDGDLDNNLYVSTPDVALFRMALGSSDGDADYNPDADVDGDGTVGTLDTDAFRNFLWGEPGPAGEL